MSVTCVEDLEALPWGAIISVKKSTNEHTEDWSKDANGAWRLTTLNSSIGLAANMFAGHIAEGWVSVGPTVTPVEVQQWREGRSYWYWVLRNQGNGTWLTMRFRRSQSTPPSLREVRMADYPPMAAAPVIEQQHWQRALWLMWERAESERATGEQNVEATRVQFKNRVDPAPLHPALAQIRASVDAMERALNPDAPVLDPF